MINGQYSLLMLQVQYKISICIIHQWILIYKSLIVHV